ncbi:conjugal transfer protein TrbC [Burkholderiales bacterium GJ-E10]|nr:conjugal transfer protein TrbC [Burkholderiales bacterium GJ-E10]
MRRLAPLGLLSVPAAALAQFAPGLADGFTNGPGSLDAGSCVNFGAVPLGTDSIMSAIGNSLGGSVLRLFVTGALIAAGGALAFSGDDLSVWIRRLLQVVMAAAVASQAAAFLVALGILCSSPW